MNSKAKTKKLKIYCFDLDGVICQTKKNYYESSKPINKAIKKINKLYFASLYR
jgi:histidinol phosphatase-like enzyme